MKWSAILVLAAAFLGPGALPAEILFKGSVVAGGKPVAGANLRLLMATDRAQEIDLLLADRAPEEIARTRSDRDGYYELRVREEGFYRLVVEAEGFLGVVHPVAALGSTTLGLYPISLLPARAATLTVLAPGGEPAAGARVRLFFEREGRAYPLWPQLLTAGEDGRLKVILPRGTKPRFSPLRPAIRCWGGSSTPSGKPSSCGSRKAKRSRPGPSIPAAGRCRAWP